MFGYSSKKDVDWGKLAQNAYAQKALSKRLNVVTRANYICGTITEEIVQSNPNLTQEELEAVGIMCMARHIVPEKYEEVDRCVKTQPGSECGANEMGMLLQRTIEETLQAEKPFTEGESLKWKQCESKPANEGLPCFLESFCAKKTATLVTCLQDNQQDESKCSKEIYQTFGCWGKVLNRAAISF